MKDKIKVSFLISICILPLSIGVGVNVECKDEVFDFRKMNMGMTYAEVRKSEKEAYELAPSSELYYNNNSYMEYDDVEVLSGYTADITYMDSYITFDCAELDNIVISFDGIWTEEELDSFMEEYYGDDFSKDTMMVHRNNDMYVTYIVYDEDDIITLINGEKSKIRLCLKNDKSDFTNESASSQKKDSGTSAKSYSSKSRSNSSSNVKNYSDKMSSYDDGYDDIYDNDDYDWDRYDSDPDYADGVDDAMDELDW
ncbi:MAG: hypothetical protein Q4B57_09815 [Eubacteriales bacterium]|nr:hypothetical protein [Eubacteriales bacterium]